MYIDERKYQFTRAVSVMTVVVLLALFIFIALFLSLFPCFSIPPALCRYLLPLLHAVSPVQQLAGSLRHCFPHVLHYFAFTMDGTNPNSTPNPITAVSRKRAINML